jgi:SAM-dependent methyltransferase
VTKSTVVQRFWLHNLASADAFVQWVIDEISPWLGHDILEVGCGIGTYTVALAKGGRRIVSIDIEDAFITDATLRAKRFPNVHFVCGDITNANVLLPGEDGFDTVILLDVLEHIEDDADLLSSLRAKLSPGGHLILKVPAMPSLYSSMDRAIGHWRRYDKNSLSEVVQRAGFEIVEMWWFNAFGIPGWWWNGRVARRQAPSEEQIANFNRLTPLFRRLDRVLRLICGSSLIAIGRRPLS